MCQSCDCGGLACPSRPPILYAVMIINVCYGCVCVCVYGCVWKYANVCVCVCSFPPSLNLFYNQATILFKNLKTCYMCPRGVKPSHNCLCIWSDFYTGMFSFRCNICTCFLFEFYVMGNIVLYNIIIDAVHNYRK